VITIEVVSVNETRPAQAITAEFGEEGGTIGRGLGSRLVLPDPELAVSRTHAEVIYRQGSPTLVVRGRNGLLVNQRLLEAGAEMMLMDGVQIQIGAYLLRVRAASAPPPEAADSATGAFRPGTNVPLVDSFGGIPPAERPVSVDALADFGASVAVTGRAATGSQNPFADLLEPAPAAATPKPPSAARGSLIPEDFDPFADPGSAAKSKSATDGEALPDDPLLGLGAQAAAGQSRSIDELFELAPGAGVAGAHPLEPSPSGNGGLPLDPIAALTGNTAPEPTHAAIPDQVSEVRGAFVAPAARPGPAMERPPLSDRAAADAGNAAPDDPLLSMFDSGGARTDVRISNAETARAAPTREPAGNNQAPPRPAPAAASVQAARTPVHDALTRALLAGLGLPRLPLSGVTPELMERIGLLLRQAVEGTVDLLHARAATKREVRAEVTMIVAKGNNPLKFSPDAAVALGHLIVPLGRGFMPPRQALRDAYDDLRAHQMGVMAGMRAALAAVLARFAPDRLERRLAQKSVLDALLPMNRKAKLWDLFHELYGDISREAEDDFHALFGREFVRAYEAQIRQLEQAATRDQA
jgi:FHA domain-containing protein